MTNRILLTMIGGCLAAASASAQPLPPGAGGFAAIDLGPIGPVPGLSIALHAAGPRGIDADERADELYDEGREAIEEGRYDRAVDRFTRLIAMKSNRTDAALYWKAYSQ